MAGGAWFRTERTGLAAKPVNWKGWAAIGLYLVADIVAAIICFAVLPLSGTTVIIFVVVSLVLTLALVIVAMRKTEGGWAWNRNQGQDSPEG